MIVLQLAVALIASMFLTALGATRLLVEASDQARPRRIELLRRLAYLPLAAAAVQAGSLEKLGTQSEMAGFALIGLLGLFLGVRWALWVLPQVLSMRG